MKVLFLLLAAIFIVLSFSETVFPKREVIYNPITIMTQSNNHQKFDSVVKNYNYNGDPIFITKYEEEEIVYKHFEYTGKLLFKEYSYNYYPNDTSPLKILRDSTIYTYTTFNKIETKLDYASGKHWEPVITHFKYDNEKRLWKKHKINFNRDSVVFDYSRKDTLKEKHYVKRELCYTKTKVAISKLDTIYNIDYFNFCNYKSKKQFRRVFNENLKVSRVYDGKRLIQEYFYDKNNALTKYIDTRIVSDPAIREFFYIYDEHNNWINKKYHFNEKLVSESKKVIQY